MYSSTRSKHHCFGCFFFLCAKSILQSVCDVHILPACAFVAQYPPLEPKSYKWEYCICTENRVEAVLVNFAPHLQSTFCIVFIHTHILCFPLCYFIPHFVGTFQIWPACLHCFERGMVWNKNVLSKKSQIFSHWMIYACQELNDLSMLTSVLYSDIYTTQKHLPFINQVFI